MNEAVDMVAGAARAATLLKPMRLQILDALREPGSAATVARRLGIARQKVNYHLRELEKAGFLEEVEERRTGNCIERIVRAKATHYLIDPEVLGSLAADPDAIQDRLSSTYLVALAAQAIRDLGALREKAAAAKKRIATFSLQTDIRFANAADRQAFAEELANDVARLVAKYHDDHAEVGRNFRLFLGAYPARRKEQS